MSGCKIMQALGLPPNPVRTLNFLLILLILPLVWLGSWHSAIVLSVVQWEMSRLASFRLCRLCWSRWILSLVESTSMARLAIGEVEN